MSAIMTITTPKPSCNVPHQARAAQCLGSIRSPKTEKTRMTTIPAKSCQDLFDEPSVLSGARAGAFSFSGRYPQDKHQPFVADLVKGVPQREQCPSDESSPESSVLDAVLSRVGLK